jgi:transmembrane sensor
MKMNQDLLVRYFLGDCSEDEKVIIQNWLESDKKHLEQFIKERIYFDASLMIDKQEIASHETGNTKNTIWKILKIAAVILLLIGCSYLINLYNSGQQSTSLLSVYVPVGNRTSITLPDGTKVWLNSNTTFTYPNVFSGKQRVVQLDGEAFFEVVKKDKASFIVETDKYHVEVLGTSFNVNAYRRSSDFETTLLAGSVKLYKDKQEAQSTYLIAGEAAQLVGDSLRISTANSDYSRWKEGLLVIDDKSFEEIMVLFEKYFGQQIIINNNKVKELGYRGKFRIIDGVDHALRVLQKDFQFIYKREEDSNKIYIN